MFGSRGRIGGISPTVMEVVPYDFYRIAPDGVGLVGITCNIDFWDNDNFDRALATLEESAVYLAARQVDYIVHFGTPLVVSRGNFYDRELIGAIETRTSIGATTSIRSAIDALRHLDAEKVAIASPYPPEINRNVEAYLKDYGFNVIANETMDVVFKQLQDVPPDEIRDFAGRVLETAPAVDALYMPCPQWPVADEVARIEADFGTTLVASDPADFWAAFRGIGLTDRIDGYGRLLASLATH